MSWFKRGPKHDHMWEVVALDTNVEHDYKKSTAVLLKCFCGARKQDFLRGQNWDLDEVRTWYA